MLDEYLLVNKKILPDYYDAVLRVRKMLEEDKSTNISEATAAVGISRSTYYKYKDYILEPSKMSIGRKAVLSMVLTHETGILSTVLSEISKNGASVLTITQSLPIRNKASVTISLDISSLNEDLTTLIKQISNYQGVDHLKLIAVE